MIEFNRVEFLDLLLNHPSHWKIIEYVRYCHKDIAETLLDRQALEMKHSMDLARMQKYVDSIDNVNKQLAKRCDQLSNELGLLKKKASDDKSDMRRLMDGMTHVPVGE